MGLTIYRDENGPWTPLSREQQLVNTVRAYLESIGEAHAHVSDEEILFRTRHTFTTRPKPRPTHNAT